jgi:hypothetical protein
MCQSFAALATSFLLALGTLALAGRQLADAEY